MDADLPPFEQGENAALFEGAQIVFNGKAYFVERLHAAGAVEVDQHAAEIEK